MTNSETLSLVVPSSTCRHEHWPAIESELAQALRRSGCPPDDWQEQVAGLRAGQQMVLSVPRSFGRWETGLHRLANVISADPGERPPLWLVHGSPA